MRRTVPPLPPALMLQGTCSNAGKSLLTAGLCRLLSRAGYDVAPFKAQNMSLNSFVTLDGGEMGRAQVLQAQACGLLPDVRMNPVLLKPTGDNGSQIILRGRPWGQMRAREYMAAKRRLWRTVVESYAELAQGRDLMLIEGAGSPAEINLRSGDIVNMRMARHAGANVLLVADIDRGGAFAALVGTLALLTRGERALVGGLVLNKFRGDASLLEPALEKISARTGKPFVGTVPWLADLGLPDEDSVSLKLSGQGASYALDDALDGVQDRPDTLDVAFVDLPRISNATDLDALAVEPDVRLRPVRTAAELGQPDCLVLPGTRNTMADMRHLRESGLAQAIVAHAGSCLATGHGCVVGICGGFQMLGRQIADPLGLEEGGTVAGLGLLPLTTTLERRKTLRQTHGHSQPPLTDIPLPVTGYEIHHGTSGFTDRASMADTADTAGPAFAPVLTAADGTPVGFGRTAATGRIHILGTYLHGLFDSDSFRHAFCEQLRQARHLPSRPATSYDVGAALDRLADCLAAHLDMKKILAPCGLAWPPTGAKPDKMC